MLLSKVIADKRSAVKDGTSSLIYSLSLLFNIN
jgi:hypothetical protein